jgi:hypothetical protein
VIVVTNFLFLDNEPCTSFTTNAGSKINAAKRTSFSLISSRRAEQVTGKQRVSLIRALKRLTLAMLPPPLAKTVGLIEFHMGRYKTFYAYDGPMNGQAARLEIVRSIIEKCEIEQIIETGTHRGTTTEWFSQFSIPVFSAEIQPRFASFARRRLAGRPNVHIENLDSVVALEHWSEASDIVSRRTLFYLDAHWEKNFCL